VAQVALVGAAGAVVTLAILRPDLDIAADPISEYVHGPFSVVQIVVFFAVGLASMVIAHAMRDALRERDRWQVTSSLTWAWAIGIVIAGFVDVEDQYFGTEAGSIHDFVAKAAFVLLALAGWSAIRLTPPRTRERHGATVLAAAMTAALLVTGVHEGTRWFGLAERALAGVGLLWLVATAELLQQAG
jgi:hypothetical protein